MSVNWRDVQEKAAAFAHEWKDAGSEDSEAKAFWVRFFDVFDVRERSLGMFERRVELLGERRGKIDFFAPNKFLVEHKSRGENLDAAFEQAANYFDALSEDEKPRFIIVSDFARFRIYDLEAEGENRTQEFLLSELPDNVTRFGFLTEEEVREYVEEEPITVRAVKTIGELYEILKVSQYNEDDLSPLLTRLVFCFFADDTGIFNRNAILDYLRERAEADDAGVGPHISSIFDVLNTPLSERQRNMPEALASLPYVNGGMFKDTLKPLFNSKDINEPLFKCMGFNWSRISPAIFGSMFQGVMDETVRRNLGAHYTSEENILKVIRGLFLDELHKELADAHSNDVKLEALWDKLARITLLDPACGCGNFLVVAYRELRRVELDIIKRLYPNGKLPKGLKADTLSKLSIERMYGIEIELFPAEIAKLSLYVIDHMMNSELGAYFGERIVKLPLKEQPHIVKGQSALAMDWEKVVSKKELTHILGNPPFSGSKIMSDGMRQEIKTLFNNAPGSGTLDYVCGWYAKAAEYIQDTDIKCAFVSTNSITQGEQPAVLWGLLKTKGIKIHFAHRTFNWANEAPNNAAVYCIIIGFGLEEAKHPQLWDYKDIHAKPHEVSVKRINPYLVDASDALIGSRSKPLCNVPEIGIGNKPIDGGMYLFDREQKALFIRLEPKSEKFFRKWIGSEEFLHNIERWCLWLGKAKPEELQEMPEVLRRIEAVRQFRLLSKSAPTRELAETPTRFHVENMPKGNYLVIPETSSENRRYIPIGFVGPETIASNAVKIMPDATLYHFGVVESEMHMTWMRAVAGRLKSDYRYSKDIVYNNFPWPEKPTAAQKKTVEEAAQEVLDTREKHESATLATLYNPNTMPADLLKAHKALDKAVDVCYGKKVFKSEPERLEFLFERYKELSSSVDITKRKK